MKLTKRWRCQFDVEGVSEFEKGETGEEAGVCSMAGRFKSREIARGSDSPVSTGQVTDDVVPGPDPVCVFFW